MVGKYCHYHLELFNYLSRFVLSVPGEKEEKVSVSIYEIGLEPLVALAVSGAQSEAKSCSNFCLNCRWEIGRAHV